MTTETIISLIVASASTIAIVSSIVLSNIRDKRNNEKLDHITKLTDGTLSAANEKIASLERLIRQLIKDKSDAQQ